MSTTTAPRRNYTDDQRSEAVALAASAGLTEAARKLDIPKPTIKTWCQQRGISLIRDDQKTAAATKAAAMDAEIARLRSTLRVKLAKAANRFIDDCDKPEIEFVGQQGREVVYPVARPQSRKNLMTAAAIAIDKLRLELGEVTDRTESRTTDQLTADIERLSDELATNDPGGE